MNSPAYTEALERSLGLIVARARGELDLLKAQADAAVAAANSKVAEAEMRCAGIEARVIERLSAVKDGLDGKDGENGQDGSPGAAGADGLPGEAGKDGEHGAKGDPGEPGKDGDPGPQGIPGERGDIGPVGPMGERGEVGIDDVQSELSEDGETLVLRFTSGEIADVHEIPLPRGPQGLSGERGADGLNGENGAVGERGLEGPPGKLPVVKAWMDAVHYEGDVRAHNGATWQATKDTGREPGDDDWICIAERGADGRDALDMVIRGTYSSDEHYSALNVVALNGASFVAKADNPGPCPGDGWQLMSAQGKRGQNGERGEKGERGERGLSGAAIRQVDLDDVTGLLIFQLSDGTSVNCDLAPLAERIIRLARA